AAMKAQAAEIIPSFGMTAAKDADMSDAKPILGLALRGTAVPSVLDLEVKGQYRQEERFNGALKERMWPITASAWLTPLRVVYAGAGVGRSEEHTSELQSLRHLVCRLLLEKKKYTPKTPLPSLMTHSRVPTSTNTTQSMSS